MDANCDAGESRHKLSVQREIVGRDFEFLAVHMAHCEQAREPRWVRASLLMWSDAACFCKGKVITIAGLVAVSFMMIGWTLGGP